MSKIAHVLFDFDGTCTQIPAIFEDFLEEYRRNFSDGLTQSGQQPVSASEWADAQKIVRANSPQQGWSVSVTPSAPVASDPYILADESAKLIARRRNIQGPSGSGLHSAAYHKFPAPWRPETRSVLEQIHNRGIGIHFVSNSSSAFVSGRLDELLGANRPIRKAITVESDAGKFFIRELTWGLDGGPHPDLRTKFERLPVEDTIGPRPFSRPIYLRRGSYFEAICKAISNDPNMVEKCLVCGDVWELDLAMAFHLGMAVHLVKRQSPFETCAYEVEKVAACEMQGAVSEDLTGVLARLP